MPQAEQSTQGFRTRFAVRRIIERARECVNQRETASNLKGYCDSVPKDVGACHCEERSDEAISPSARGCFASLAMTWRGGHNLFANTI
jgi:hypothetical protein